MNHLCSIREPDESVSPSPGRTADYRTPDARDANEIGAFVRRNERRDSVDSDCAASRRRI
jgi:hypothetical protein